MPIFVPENPTVRRVLAYAGLFVVFFFLLNLFVLQVDKWRTPTYITETVEDQDGSGYLVDKRNFYIEQPERFDAIFLGDSRTLCGMHADFLEPYWGLKGFTLAHWSNWFPTQYALLSDIIDHIPDGTVVVWSVGLENFGLSPIEEIYPVGWKRLPAMGLAGYPLDDLFVNAVYFTDALIIVGQRLRLFNFIQKIFNYPVKHFAPLPGSGSQEADQSGHQSLFAEESGAVTHEMDKDKELLDQFRNEPGVGYIRPWYDGERLVSIAQYKTNGATLRTELVPEYYRQKQKEMYNQELSKAIHFHPASWMVFERMLGMLKERGFTVIVNEMDLSPHKYISEEDHKKAQKILRDKLIPVVESYGFQYVYVDYDTFTVSDYFDYNHLNSKGVEKFSRQLGPQLKAALEDGR